GNIDWLRQFGAPGLDFARGVAADGSVYVAGNTFGTLPDQTHAGAEDAFVRKYDAAGNVLWTRQFGTAGSDQANGVAVDATGVYVVGLTVTSADDRNAFVLKLDTDGNALWSRQISISSNDEPTGVAVDGSAVYVLGESLAVLTDSSFSDGFVRKY